MAGGNDNDNQNQNVVTPEEFNALRSSITELQKSVTKLSEENTKKDKLIAELTKKGDSKETKKEPLKLPTETFKVGKQEFRFKLKAFQLTRRKGMPDGLIPYTGKTITAVDALQDSDILKELVRIKSNVIEEVTKD